MQVQLLQEISISCRGKHKNFLNDMTVDGMVDLIIMKAETKDGEKGIYIRR